MVAAIVLAFNNPTISGTSEGRCTCRAPYDSALLGADNLRGDLSDGPDIASPCDVADKGRCAMASVLAGVGEVLGMGATAEQIRKPPST